MAPRRYHSLLRILICLSAMIVLCGCAIPWSSVIESQPAGAKVYYDGEYIGTTPFQHVFEETPSSVGTHLLIFKKQSYVDGTWKIIDRANIIKVPGSEYPERINLKLEPMLGSNAYLEATATSMLRLPENGGLRKIGAGRRWAVVVGLSKYAHAGSQGLTQLAYARADAEAFREALVRNGWSDNHIRFLADSDATKSEIETWLRYGPDLEDALFVLYWAGHGYPDPVDQRKLFLACYDTTLANPGTGLRMSDVRQWLEERKARNVVVIADACHAGGLITGRGTDDASARGLAVRMKPKDVPSGWIYLLGARTGDKAFEHPSLRGGLFTTSLVEGMKGGADGYGLIGNRDGAVTMGELREYVRDKVKEQAFRLNLTGAFEIEDQTNTGDRNVWDLTFRAE